MREKAHEGMRYDIPRLPSWVGVKVIYPFHGAAARVMFYDVRNENIVVSTYLDVEDNLGVMEHPYFEIYPDASGDTDRFYHFNQEQMYPEVIKSLKRQRRDRKKADKQNETK
jgi:hypothetical protein